MRNGPLWRAFEDRVVDCCNRVMRPYAVASPAISSRMLSVHGRGATMPTSTMMGLERRALAYVKNTHFSHTQPQPQPQPKPSHHMRCIPADLWNAQDSSGKASLVHKYILTAPRPFFSTSLPERYAQSQLAACRQDNARRPIAHVCDGCRSCFLVAFHIPGLRIEALGGFAPSRPVLSCLAALTHSLCSALSAGNVITDSWHCPVCEDAPPLRKIDLVGQLVHATNGIFAACRICAAPILYSENGIFCSECTPESIADAESKKQILKMRCWNTCSRPCVQEFRVIPPDGIDDGQRWPRLHACALHALPPEATQQPIPYADIRRTWWHSR